MGTLGILKVDENTQIMSIMKVGGRLGIAKVQLGMMPRSTI